MAKYDLQFQKTDTLGVTMSAGASSATLSSGNFGSPSGVQIIVVDYNVPAKAAAFTCTISGTSVTSMTLVHGPDVEHTSGAKVGINFTPTHYDALRSGIIWNSDLQGGWIAADVTWTYASADDPTFTFTVSGDYTGVYTPGMRIKLTQTSVKYFIITAVSYSAPNTTVTIYGGTDYDLANAAITSPYFSPMYAPNGFPLDKSKWTVTTTNTGNNQQSSPSQNVWYNLGSISIDVPIGAWEVSYDVLVYCYKASGTNVEQRTTLSTANNSESDTSMTSTVLTTLPSGALEIYLTARRERSLALSSKTTYYLNHKTMLPGQDTLATRGDITPTLVRAVCAYL